MSDNIRCAVRNCGAASRPGLMRRRRLTCMVSMRQDHLAGWENKLDHSKPPLFAVLFIVNTGALADLEEVIVTAQKRSQKIENVAISVAVVGLDQPGAGAVRADIPVTDTPRMELWGCPDFLRCRYARDFTVRKAPSAMMKSGRYGVNGQ